MLNDLRSLTPQNIWDAIDLLNRTSRDTSLRYDLDIFGFGRLTRYWGISYEYSLLCYVGGKAAALILNCVEPETRDAYTFFWGVLPEFRTGRIAIALVEAACQRLRDNGYLMHYAVAIPDRPARRYRFVKFQAECGLVDMEAQSLVLRAADSSYTVREITVEEMPQLRVPENRIHWCQRHVFLRKAEPYLKFVGAFAGETLKSYAVLVSHAANTTLSDIRVFNSCFPAGFELLRWLEVHEDYRPPLTVTYVLEGSETHSLLSAAGFTVTRQFSLLSRDLRTTVALNANAS
jgi:hypothetical protein